MHRRVVVAFLNTVRQIRATKFVSKARVVFVEPVGYCASVALGASLSAKMHTRGNVVEKEKEKYLAMTIEERRNQYKCGTNYVTLSKVKTWSEYYKELPDKKVTKTGKTKVEVNAKLNDLVSIWRGDITKLEIDAIVNAANNRLLGGGGVDGAIHTAAGSNLTAECATLNGCETGDAKITLGYKLPASRVIHTVGPIGENSSKLRSCYAKCLKIVQDQKLKSVAFPCISTGIYGYPNRNAAEIALETTRKWLEKDDNAERVERVIFCLFLEGDVKIFEELMQEYFPTLKDECKPDEANKTDDAKKTETEDKQSDEPAKTDDSIKEEDSKKAKSEEDVKPTSGDAPAAETQETQETKKPGDDKKPPTTKL